MKRPRRQGQPAIEPILKAIVRTAARLCDARYAHLHLVDGTRLAIAAKHGRLPRTLSLGESLPLSRGSVAGRAVVDRRTVHVRDLKVASKSQYPDAARLHRAAGLRTMLATPLVQDGRAVGALVVLRTTVRPFTAHQIALLKTFAEQAAIALENARLSRELEARNSRLSEALEQQTATGKILSVISSSPTEIQPVLNAVVENAARFCGAYDASILLREDDNFRGAAHHGPLSAPPVLVPVVRGSVAGRCLLERRPVHVVDLLAEAAEFPVASAFARDGGFRAMLSVPLLREGEATGVIQLRRLEAEPFTDRQISLLQSFADQAVIAIENVRLFTELGSRNHDLTESLEQQTATADILGVISSSPTDVQPVLDAVAENSARLCGALFASVYLFDGELIDMRAQFNYPALALERSRQFFPTPPHRRLFTGRAILDRAVIHVPDVLSDPEFVGQDFADEVGFRSVLSVPMLRDGHPIGAITVWRAEVGPFTDRQVALLRTFADQAVIAIENVRLFTELQTRNGEITEALEQQTATSEILQVISSSPTDLQPVFDIIAESAVKLCGAEVGLVTRFDGEWVDVKAMYGSSSAGIDALRRAFPMRPSGAGAAVRAIRDRAIAHIPDVLVDEEYGIQEAAVAGGFRAVLAVPMLREGSAVGSVGIGRSEAGEFSERQINLLRTFADQAMIAIENVRLFTELGVRNRDLTESLEQQTATAEILHVISSSPTDVRPVFATIAKNARRLCKSDSASVLILDNTHLRLETVDNASEEGAQALRAAYPSPVTHRSAGGRAVLTGRAVHIPDVLEDPDYEFAGLQGAGLRSMLSVPMLRHGTAIGAIVVHTWASARPFSSKQMELLQTFANQAVIAIENARLFKELQARTSELTRSVDQLTALGEISQAVSSTLDVETVLQTIVSRATQLAGADGCAIYEYDEASEAFHIRATHNLDPVLVAALRTAPLRKGEGTMGRAAETREPIQVADIAVAGAYQSHIRDTLLGAGYRALLSVPLLREGEIIGSLSLNRHAPGEFPPEAVEVLKTFATQSALAIQNARLFREIADKSRLLEAASRHKSEFLANMSHELRTPLNAIIGFSEVLNEQMFGELNPKQAEYLKDIHASGTHLLSLINDILDLSKVEAGRMELELSDFSLPAAIDSALTLVRERATRRGVSLRAAVHEGISEVSGDERKIRQVLLNLLSNAIKFTPEGGQIEVTAVPENGAVDVSVIDTGVGIAPEDHEAVFEEFRQVGESAAKQEGTGLGLALCRKFVELHGGEIWVTSALGAGSTFTFRLPVRS
jgi:GAF domain-containing protein